jgi:hypothetical protein
LPRYRELNIVNIYFNLIIKKRTNGYPSKQTPQYLSPIKLHDPLPSKESILKKKHQEHIIHNSPVVIQINLNLTYMLQQNPLMSYNSVILFIIGPKPRLRSIEYVDRCNTCVTSSITPSHYNVDLVWELAKVLGFDVQTIDVGPS